MKRISYYCSLVLAPLLFIAASAYTAALLRERFGASFQMRYMHWHLLASFIGAFLLGLYLVISLRLFTWYERDSFLIVPLALGLLLSLLLCEYLIFYLAYFFPVFTTIPIFRWLIFYEGHGSRAAIFIAFYLSQIVFWIRGNFRKT